MEKDCRAAHAEPVRHPARAPAGSSGVARVRQDGNAVLRVQSSWDTLHVLLRGSSGAGSVWRCYREVSCCFVAFYFCFTRNACAPPLAV